MNIFVRLSNLKLIKTKIKTFADFGLHWFTEKQSKSSHKSLAAAACVILLSLLHLWV